MTASHSFYLPVFAKPASPIEHCGYFFHSFDRAAAEAEVQTNKGFLFRHASVPGHYALTFIRGDTIQHCLLREIEGTIYNVDRAGNAFGVYSCIDRLIHDLECIADRRISRTATLGSGDPVHLTASSEPIAAYLPITTQSGM